MKTVKDRISEIAYYLQSLMHPDVFQDVEKAVKEGNSASLIEACKKGNVPPQYISTLVPLLVSIRQPKWPLDM